VHTTIHGEINLLRYSYCYHTHTLG